MLRPSGDHVASSACISPIRRGAPDGSAMAQIEDSVVPPELVTSNSDRFGEMPKRYGYGGSAEFDRIEVSPPAAETCANALWFTDPSTKYSRSPSETKGPCFAWPSFVICT